MAMGLDGMKRSWPGAGGGARERMRARLRRCRRESGLAGRGQKKAHSLHFQEVADHLVAAFGEHAFRMELDTFDGQSAMTQAHDDASRAAVLGGAGGDGELGGSEFSSTISEW